MKKKISLTIGIPMYNHEKTIITTLDSILCQLDEIKNFITLNKNLLKKVIFKNSSMISLGV